MSDLDIEHKPANLESVSSEVSDEGSEPVLNLWEQLADMKNRLAPVNPGHQPENLKAPKIDFRRKPTRKLTELKIEKFEGIAPPGLVKLLCEHYAQISAILGLEDVDDEYGFIVTDTGEVEGSHTRQSQVDGKPRIELSLDNFRRAARQFTVGPNYVEKSLGWGRYHQLVEMISALAHELYHKRQFVYFRTYALQRERKYVSEGADHSNRQQYRQQTLEVGARAFAKKYMEFLEMSLDQNDNSELAQEIRKFGKAPNWEFKQQNEKDWGILLEEVRSYMK